MPESNPTQGVSSDDELHQSIRQTLAEMMPEYAAVMTALQGQMRANNEMWVENIVRGMKEVQVEVFDVTNEAIHAPKRHTCGFPIRYVVIKNNLGVDLFYGPDPINGAAGGADVGYINQAFAINEGGLSALPVNFNQDIYVRMGASLTFTTATWARVYCYSQPFGAA